MSWQSFANTSAVSARGLVCSDWSTLLRTTWRKFISPEEGKHVNTSTETLDFCIDVTEFVKKCLTSVGYSGCDQFVEQVVWDRGAVLVVARHSSQGLLLPNPVLKHLRRHLHKVRLHQGSTEF